MGAKLSEAYAVEAGKTTSRWEDRVGYAEPVKSDRLVSVCGIYWPNHEDRDFLFFERRKCSISSVSVVWQKFVKNETKITQNSVKMWYFMKPFWEKQLTERYILEVISDQESIFGKSLILTEKVREAQ